jgi:hypothetical protein
MAGFHGSGARASTGAEPKFKSKSESNEMKWLSGGLTFVNFATICGLLIGMVTGGLSTFVARFGIAIAPGLSTTVAWTAIVVGAVFALLAYLTTEDPQSAPQPSDRDQSPFFKYRKLPIWILAGFFTIFAVRSFCWLLFVDGSELKIQSPVNLGDLGLHLTHIKFFANGVRLWPSNPIYVFSDHLRYPAGIDFFNALLLKANVDLIPGLVWVGLLASIATCYALYRWGGGFAIAGFLFNGGLAGFQFFRNFKFVDYQDVNNIAWKSIPLTMFVTQRGLLYAIPVGLLLLWHWREKYFRGGQDRQSGPLPFWVELSLYASMPLFHVHTFMALSIVLACFFVAGDPQIRGHTLTLLLSALVPATFFVWLISDHFHAGSVLEFHPGWAQNEGEFKMSFFRFWFFNFGILVPLGLTLVGLIGWQVFQSRETRRFELSAAIAIGFGAFVVACWRVGRHGFSWSWAVVIFLSFILLAWSAARVAKSGFGWKEKLPEEVAFIFTATVIFIFFFSIKTAPWIWDNLKIGIWAYFIVLPFLWRQLITQWELPIRAAVCFALFFSGFVSLFGGLAAGKGGFGFANRGELDAVDFAVRKMPLEARFAAYPTYNHPLLLNGRKVVMGYPGHLWTQGFDEYGKTNELLTQLMQGAPNWRDLARTLRVRYIFWGREEKTNYASSARPWEKTAALAASGTWGGIYDLEKPPAPSQIPTPATSQ